MGKRFTPTFYWGLGAGVVLPVSDGGDPTIPVTSDFRLYFPLRTSKLVLGGVMRLGYAINTADDITTGSGKHKKTVKMSNSVMIQVLPTLTVPISPRTDFNVGIGYTHFIATGGGSGSGAVTISTGFNFGRPSSFAKQKRPILDRGIQLSLDLGAQDDGYNGIACIGLAASYQFNPHLAVGLGFGYDLNASYDTYRFFARGVYRLSKKRFSPIAACDIGLRFNSDTQFFIAPAVGGSLRMASNSYLNLKVGYHIEKDLSGVLLNLGFTHTFGWGFGKK